MSDYGEHCERLAGLGVGDGELRDYEYSSCEALAEQDPETESDNDSNETREGHWPTVKQQKQYWSDKEQERMADPENGFVQWLEEKYKRLPF